jgi:multidrug efflux pump subunit AcrA (membrane-fusion protein)
VAIVLLVVLALVASALLIRRGDGGRVVDDQEEGAADDPIVAPSRVVAVGDEPRVVLDSAERRRIGLSLAGLRSAAAQAGRRLPGQVIPEPERTVTLRAPVSGRLALAEGGRWPALGERLEAGTVLGRVSDAQPLTLPMGGTVTAIGARPGEIVSAGQVLLELADRTHPVVRVVWPPDAGRPPERLTILPGAGDTPLGASLIGPAPEADPVTRQPTYLYRVRSRWTGAVPGTPVSALVPERGGAEGVLVPDDAVVQWEGLAWVYVRRGEGEYARVRVPTDRPAPGGWVAGPPLAVGDSVVVTGVQELLSEEFRARVTVGEESGE